jgi:hypothetical protein
MVSIDGYPLDLVETEEHSLTSEITEHPVEDGSDISDNIRNKPRELTLTNAIVSDTPIGTIANDETRILGSSLPPPSDDAFRRLEQIWLDRRTVTVVTKRKKYENMALETLTTPSEAKNAGALVFTAHFKEVRIVKNKRVTVKIPNTGGENNLGLSLDRIIEGKNVLWRKGKPPGSSPSTVPPGVITGQEVVTVKDRGEKPAQLLHANGKPLTTDELNAFTLDLNRDSALASHRTEARQAAQIKQEEDRTANGLKLAQYKLDHPGQNPDPKLFGL